MAVKITRYVAPSGAKPNTQVIPEFALAKPTSPFSASSKSGERFMLDDWLYDSVKAVSVNTSSLFQTPKGQSSKTFTHTNQTQSGLMPYTKQFLVEGYSIFLHPWNLYDTDDTYHNILRTLFDGYFQIFKKGGTVVQTGPLHMIAQFKCRDFFSRVSGETSYRHFYTLENPHMSAKGYFPLSKEGRYLLEHGDEFYVDLKWESTISASNLWYMYFVFWGKSDRNM